MWAVGASADGEVYAEATARFQAASGQQPEIRKLADVIERLGKLSGGVTVPPRRLASLYRTGSRSG